MSPGAPLTFPGLHLELTEGLLVTGRDDGVLPVQLPLRQQLHQLPGRALRADAHQGEPGAGREHVSHHQRGTAGPSAVPPLGRARGQCIVWMLEHSVY